MGAKVDWDPVEKTAKVEAGNNRVWAEPVTPVDAKVRDAISVVSRFFAYLIGYSPENVNDLVTSRGLDPYSPNSVMSLLMPSAEWEHVAFEIRDIRKSGDTVEVATRLYRADMPSSGVSAGYSNYVLTVVFSVKDQPDGTRKEIPLIDAVVAGAPGGGVDELW